MIGSSTFLVLLAMAPEAAWVVTVPVANMYWRASEDAPVVSQAIYGTNVAVLEETGGWKRVRTPDDYDGWMTASSLYRRAEGPYAAAGRVAFVTSLFANLYREPDVTRRRPLLTVPFETRLEVVEEPEAEGRRWIRVRLADGGEAWIQRGDVSLVERRLSVGETIALARRFLGLPYLWGGVSTFGFDCSGFTQMLARRRGLLMPRDAAPQSRWEGAEPVAPQDLEPGDLLYFGESADRITHTGMYLGEGEFIHATAYLRPMVQISRLEDPHWAERLVACRRPKAGASK
jgi:SH3-like domain-containing protein